MLMCPDCRVIMKRVVDSRVEHDGRLLRRRLECGECLDRFTSYEIRDSDLIDGSTVEFYKAVNRAKEQSRLDNKQTRNLPPTYKLIGVRRSKRTIFQAIKSYCCC